MFLYFFHNRNTGSRHCKDESDDGSVHFYDEMFVCKSKTFSLILAGCVLLFSCAGEEGTGDVEMAGMTMTLVLHMRMMSSIVL